MRTLTIFTYNELPTEEAKGKALKAALDKWQTMLVYGWHGENKHTLEAFCDHFGIETREWHYSTYDWYCSLRWSEDWLECTGLAAYRRLSRLFSSLYKAKRYEGKTGKTRLSRIIKAPLDCPLSGYCLDYNILSPLEDHLKRPNLELLAGDVLQKCLDAWAKSASEDVAYAYSADALLQELQDDATAFEFTEHGALI